MTRLKPKCKKICAHCKTKLANRPRGLCWNCYYAEGVKEYYAKRFETALVADLSKLESRSPPREVPRSYDRLCGCGQPLRSYQGRCEDCTVDSSPSMQSSGGGVGIRALAFRPMRGRAWRPTAEKS